MTTWQLETQVCSGHGNWQHQFITTSVMRGFKLVRYSFTLFEVSYGTIMKLSDRAICLSLQNKAVAFL